MSDHRAHPRAPIELKVVYQRMNAFFADYTRDISKGGLFLKTDTPLPIGTELDFEVALPKRDPLHLHGCVQWADPTGMGLRFVWANDQARIAFETMVEELMMSTLGESLYKQLIERGKRA